MRIVRVIHRYGLKKVRLTGGEPLLRDDLIPLISTLKHRIGIHDRQPDHERPCGSPGWPGS